MRKPLLHDLRSLGIPLDNVEGMTIGPQLPDGRSSLVLVSDNTSPQASSRSSCYSPSTDGVQGLGTRPSPLAADPETTAPSRGALAGPFGEIGATAVGYTSPWFDHLRKMACAFFANAEIASSGVALSWATSANICGMRNVL